MPNWRGFEIASDFEMGFWPVLVYSAPPSIHDKDMVEVIESLGLIRSLKIPFCMVLDLRNNKGISAQQRKMITDAMTERDDESKKLVRGLGKVFSDPKAAIAWAQARLTPGHEMRTTS